MLHRCGPDDYRFELSLADAATNPSAADWFRWRFQKADQLSDRAVPVPRVPERQFFVNLVAVPASVSGLCEVAGFLEVVDDLRRRSLGDPDVGCDIS